MARSTRTSGASRFFDTQRSAGARSADYIQLQQKHPDQFAAPADVRRHVEFVLAVPEIALAATKPSYTLLTRRATHDQAVVIEFVLRGGKYRIRSAYVLTDGQLAHKLREAQRQSGAQFPKFLAVNPATEAEKLAQGAAAPSDAGSTGVSPAEAKADAKITAIPPGVFPDNSSDTSATDSV